MQVPGKPERGGALAPASRRRGGRAGRGVGAGRLSPHWGPLRGGETRAAGERAPWVSPSSPLTLRLPQSRGWCSCRGPGLAPSKHLLTLLFRRVSLPPRGLLASASHCRCFQRIRPDVNENNHFCFCSCASPGPVAPKSAPQLRGQCGLGLRDPRAGGSQCGSCRRQWGWRRQLWGSPCVRGAPSGGLHCA